jgi:subtilisin family serine protease
MPSRWLCCLVFGLLIFFSAGQNLHAQESIGSLLPPQPLDLDSVTAQSMDAVEPESSAEVVTVLLELVDEPSVQTYLRYRDGPARAQATLLAQDQLDAVNAAQEALLVAAPLADATVIYRTQRVHNGVALLVDADRLEEIRQLPGVVAVHPLPTFSIERTRTTPFLGTPTLWEDLYAAGLDGAEISVGIIDTGIDYLHTDFGGPGSGYELNDTNVITDIPYFPSAKVVGGYDFAGDRYDGRATGNPIPEPDPDPMDCWGHGTHVAGIAAGYGVLHDRTTYRGPYDSSLDFSRFAIGPGIAPHAQLYALKVFGCSGVSQLVTAAIEWAVDPNGDGDFSDRLDVLNLSVGSSFGASSDPTSVAVDNAVAAGIVVVASAGNSGDIYYIVASPSVAGGAISVGASETRGLPNPWQSPVEPNSFLDSLAAFSSRGPRRGDALLKPDIVAPGVSIYSAAARTGSGGATSSGTSMAAPQVAGAAALLRQLHPGWTAEEIKALLLNTARYDLPASKEDSELRYGVGRTGAGRLDIDTARQAQVLVYNASHPGEVTLSFGAPEILDEFSALKNVRLANKSAVTRTYYATYAPVVDLPGAGISLSGSTLYEVPAYGTRNVPVLFSAQANNLKHIPDPTVARRNLFPRHWLSEESGYLYFWPQITPFNTRLRPTTGGLPASAVPVGEADFRLDPASGILSYTLSITATGALTVSAANLHYGTAYESGVVVASLSDELLMGPGSVTATGAITLSSQEAQWLASGRIYLAITLDGHVTGALRGQLDPQESVLRLPVYVAPRAVAAMRSTVPELNYGDAAQGLLPLSLVGQGILSAGDVAMSRAPTDTISLVTALELQHSSPRGSSNEELFEYADLKHVGVASNYRRGLLPSGAPTGIAETMLIFGIATHAEWSTPNEVSFQIRFDINGDGIVDYILRTTNLGSFQGPGATDEFITVLVDLVRGEVRATYFTNIVSSLEYNTGLFNNNVLLMAVNAAELGLTEQHTKFRYVVSSYTRGKSGGEHFVDYTSLLTYDVANPGISVYGKAIGELPIYYDLPGTELTVQFTREAFYRNRSKGLLLIHHHNELRYRTEVIPIHHRWTLYMPEIHQNR